MTAHANDGGWTCECGRENDRVHVSCPACGILHLRVSQLETFRYWADNEDASLDDLLARLRGEGPESEQMAAGKALAKFWELAREGEYGEAHVDGWSFDFQLDLEFARPELRELAGAMRIETPSGPVWLTGHCDGLEGRAVHDQKLTERWDAEKYLDSLQWRAYLVMFEARTFVYDVFVGRYGTGRNQGQVAITEYHPLTFYAYPDMRRDVERAVAELAAVIVRHIPDRVAA